MSIDYYYFSKGGSSKFANFRMVLDNKHNSNSYHDPSAPLPEWSWTLSAAPPPTWSGWWGSRSPLPTGSLCGWSRDKFHSPGRWSSPGKAARAQQWPSAQKVRDNNGTIAETARSNIRERRCCFCGCWMLNLEAPVYRWPAPVEQRAPGLGWSWAATWGVPGARWERTSWPES